MGFQIAVGPATGSDDSEHLTVVAAGGGFGPGPMADASPLKDIPEVRLVDYSVAGDTIPLPELYTRVAESGLLQEAKSIVTDLLPDIENIEILTQQNQPTVYLFYKTGALPTAAAGDGIQVLLRQSLELAAPVGGVVLI
jgi:hypothetical protein